MESIRSHALRVMTASNGFKVVRIELVACLYGMAQGLVSVINTNLIIDKICRNNLNYSSTVCDDLNNDTSDQYQIEVQKQTTTISLYMNVISGIVTLIFTSTLAPKANRLGKRYSLSMPLIGMAIAQLTIIVNIFFWNARAEYLLFSCIYSFFGGNTTFFLGLYSYTATTSLENSRTSRISILDAAVMASVSGSTFLSGYVYYWFGYYAIYGIAFILYAINVILIDHFLEERPLESRQMSNSDTSSSINVFKSMSQPLKLLFQSRPGFKRASLLLLFFTMMLLVSISTGDFTYLYTRKVLDWDEQTYTKLISLFQGLNCFSSSVLLPFFSWILCLPDLLLGWASAMSIFLNMLMYAMARDGNVMLLGCILGILTPISSSIIRSQISKLVGEDAICEIYSVLGCMEAFLVLTMTPVVTVIYNYTIHFDPSFIFYFRSILAGIVVINFITLAVLRKKDNSQFLLQAEESDQMAVSYNTFS